MDIIYDFEDGDEPINDDVDGKFEYFHDFDSYFRFINRLPKLLRLMESGEFVGDDAIDF